MNSEDHAVERILERIIRLEEAQAFGERGVEQLSGEIYALGRRLDELVARVARLEHQAARAAESKAAGDDPAEVQDGAPPAE